MVSKRISVTNNVTLDSLEDISSKGYNCYWDVAVNGYQWNSGLREDGALHDFYPKAPELPHSMMQGPEVDNPSSRLFFYPISGKEGFDQCYIARLVKPDFVNSDRQWLVQKGDLLLQQSQPPYTPVSKLKVIDTRRYKPLSDTTLHRRFASIKTENLETEILNFANEFGFLGRTTVLSPPRSQPSAVVKGERFYQWRIEIDKMGILLALWDLIREEKAGKLVQFIRWDRAFVDIRFKWRSSEGRYELFASDVKKKANGAPVLEEGYGYLSRRIHRALEPDFFNEYKLGEVIGPAWYFLGGEINACLHGIRPKFIGLDIHKKEVFYVAKTLLDALWLLFMLEVNGKIKTDKCKYCDKWFAYERNSKDYCNGNCRRLAFYHRKKA